MKLCVGNLGDKMDYAQAKRDFRNIGEMIEETLNLLEARIADY